MIDVYTLNNRSKRKKMKEEFEMQIDQSILQGMNELEARAYKLLYIWAERSRKVFPNYNHTKIKRKGDPRKSHNFRMCYKLVRMTQNMLHEDDYILYVRAQLEILQVISRTQEHPIIDINCLVGEKAWKRWKLWKKKYDNAKKVIKGEEIVAPEGVVITAIKNTKEFLNKKFGTYPSYEEFQKTTINENIFRWIKFGQISPYYLILSPYVKRAFPAGIDKSHLNLDLSIYEKNINDQIRNEFEIIFEEEFTSAKL